MQINTALLVIDVQVGLTTGAEPIYDAEAVLGRIAALIARARAAGAPVVYVQDKDVGGVGTPEWQIDPAVAPEPGDLLMRKSWGDSFYETDLHDQLRARGVGRLAVAGLKTNFCVDATCRRAVALGYDVVLASDAHSTTDNRVLSAAQTIAYHNDLLWGFGEQDGFGAGKHWIEVVPSAEIALA